MARRRHLTREERHTFAEKVMDWGNLVFGGLVIGQIVPGTVPFRFGMFSVGLAAITCAYVFAYWFLTRGKE